jgi:hypothetical protein
VSEIIWYPFSTLHNVAALEKLSAAAGFQLLDLCRGPHARIADIGAADGDLAFLLEKQGVSVDVSDNEYTNFNGLEGARTRLHLGRNAHAHTDPMELGI